MIIEMLRAKIHGATVTDSNINYMGSIGIGKNLVKEAGFYINEKVDVYNLSNGNRFTTYVIEEEDNKICINGAAAHLAKTGDKVIIASYCGIKNKYVKEHKPKVLIVDASNSVKKC